MSTPLIIESRKLEKAYSEESILSIASLDDNEILVEDTNATFTNYREIKYIIKSSLILVLGIALISILIAFIIYACKKSYIHGNIFKKIAIYICLCIWAILGIVALIQGIYNIATVLCRKKADPELEEKDTTQAPSKKFYIKTLRKILGALNNIDASKDIHAHINFLTCFLSIEENAIAREDLGIYTAEQCIEKLNILLVKTTEECSIVYDSGLHKNINIRVLLRLQKRINKLIRFNDILDFISTFSSGSKRYLLPSTFTAIKELAAIVNLIILVKLSNKNCRLKISDSELYVLLLKTVVQFSDLHAQCNSLRQINAKKDKCNNIDYEEHATIIRAMASNREGYLSIIQKHINIFRDTRYRIALLQRSYNAAFNDSFATIMPDEKILEGTSIICDWNASEIFSTTEGIGDVFEIERLLINNIKLVLPQLLIQQNRLFYFSPKE